MGTTINMRHCEQCNKVTEHIEHPPNHILMLLLAIVFAGLVTILFGGAIATAVIAFLAFCVFVWLPAIGLQRSPQCRACGTKTGFWKL
ncbi:hypothetical protein [Marinobacterium lutimaris]|uniref:Uncharacterized protein n=1 Tax=Marinobacterium lutimaris TaxID=568106 RepID=A0A1H5XVF9_9GAMM|nr:hypothetical protein [Marinobacterium lutimaris]SEG15633.1 hypothetical protein SAMN05444390_1011517 [Marinobacterium lutimaris]